jgi:hypothetical protein
MRFFSWLRWLRSPRLKTLVVMRSADMRRVHPQTDFSHKCSTCSAEVGIYPSGQAIIRKFGEARVKIICNQCVDAGDVSHAQPAPGALAEIGQSIRREP